MQMKANLMTEIAQPFAILAEPVVGNLRRLACKTKTIMKTKSAQLIPVIALELQRASLFHRLLARAGSTSERSNSSG